MPVNLKPSQALHLWHDVSLAMVRRAGPDLTVRQFAILMEVYLVQRRHTVTGLAQTLGVTKPVITRALDSMGKMGLVERVRDSADRRNVIVRRTVNGSLYIEAIGDIILACARLEHD